MQPEGIEQELSKSLMIRGETKEVMNLQPPLPVVSGSVKGIVSVTGMHNCCFYKTVMQSIN